MRSITITILICVSRYMVMVDIYNYLLLLPSLFLPTAFSSVDHGSVLEPTFLKGLDL